MGANSTQKELGYDLVQPHCEVRVLAAAPPCSCPKILQENHNWSLYTDKYFGEGASLALQSVFQGVGDVTDVFLFLSTTSLMESRGQPRTKLAFLSSFLSVSVIGAFPPGHNDVEDAVFFFYAHTKGPQPPEEELWPYFYNLVTVQMSLLSKGTQSVKLCSRRSRDKSSRMRI